MSFNRLRLAFFGCVVGLAMGAQPRGHLQPLGSHMDPEGAVFEMDGFPKSPLEFFDDYIVPSKPVIFREAAKGLNGFKLWTDEYLARKYGKELVEVEEGKKEDRDMGMWTETFGDFLRKYQGKDSRDQYRGNFYSVSSMPDPMREEYELPPPVDCPAFLKNEHGGMKQINHWFSSGGTSSVLHKDGFENMNCVMDGNKDMVFIAPSYTPTDLHWDFSDNHHHSHIDCEAVDLLRYPNFKRIKWWSAHLNKGDCLFIPSGWYHHVKSHAGDNTRNMAINLWWNMDKSPSGRKLVAKQCKKAPSTPTRASQVLFTGDQKPQMEQDL